MEDPPPRLSLLQRELIEQRELLETLKQESAIEPIKVSVALGDLINFIESNAADDKLITGFKTPKDNPYLEKGGCTIA